MLKPALSQGALQCIGATTMDEYRKYIEKDRALERRFQPIIIEEETEENSIITLSNFKKFYEKHHGITIDDDAIEAAVLLSSRYIQDRFLPDKAFDVLDEAASKLKTVSSVIENTKKLKELEKQKFLIEKKKEDAIAQENYQDAIVLKYKQGLAEEEVRRFGKNFTSPTEKPRLTKYHIQEIITDITGIPVKNKDGHQHLKKLTAYLNKEIIGQKEAIETLVETLKRKDAGLTDAGRPTGSFLFIGPCGIGKTALAKALAEFNSQKLIKLDMSEYAEPYTISRLIGSPPGYVGYGESGELTEKIRRNPHAIVLFDEIEKAHPQVHNLLLSILEDGTLQDGSGRNVSFKNAIIILTSNNIAEDFQDSDTLGFSSRNFAKSRNSAQTNNKYLEGVKDALRPELINRIDKIIAFNQLGKKEIYEITKLHLGKLKNRLNSLDLTFSDQAISHISHRAYKQNQGARLVRSTVEQIVEGPLAEFLIKYPEANSAKVGVKKGKVIVS
jgi:ATP-dependent Clp protease ATP-binding subunit ClpC